MYALKERYKNEIREELKKALDIKNPMLLPKLEKIVISVGAGEYAKRQKSCKTLLILSL